MKKLLLILAFNVSIINVLPQDSELRFQHYTIKDGLSQSAVKCIFQDSEGFMWFGTTNKGVNRFDGYKFTSYYLSLRNSIVTEVRVHTIFEDSKKRLWLGCAGNGGLFLYNRDMDTFSPFFQVSNDNNSIFNDVAYSISEDQQGYLWIATNRGLIKLNPNSEEKSIIRYLHNDNPTSIADDRIYRILNDSKGNLWVGTLERGLDLFDASKQEFIHFVHNNENSYSLLTDNVSSIFESADGTIWIGSFDGLNKMVKTNSKDLQPDNVKFIHYKNIPGNTKSLSNNSIYSICEQVPGQLWICTTNGLNMMNYAEPGEEIRFIQYNYDPLNLESINGDFVYDAYFDSFGAMWIGTTNGLNKTKKLKFPHYKQGVNNGLKSNKIEAFLEDSKGNIWICTSKGINTFNRENNKLGSILPNTAAVLSVTEDHKGNLWFGTWGKGLIEYNPISNNYVSYEYQEDDTNSLSDNDISCLFEDGKNNLWIGTWGGGINLFDRENKRFIRFHYDAKNNNRVSKNYTNTIFEDSKGNFWVGTVIGLNLLKNKIGQNFSVQDNLSDSTLLFNDNIRCVYEASNGIVWVGGMKGLYKIDASENNYILYTTDDGLPDNVVAGILEDDKGNLWVSFMNGFAKISVTREKQTSLQKTGLTITNFDITDGLQGKEFVSQSCCKIRSGEMFFGGRNGFNMFHPDSIKTDSLVPRVAITGFQLFNKDVSIGEVINGDTILKKSITQTKKITLSWKNNVFSFQFAALHYVAPMQNKYAYRMEGFDKPDVWNYANADRRYVSYTNLNPGKYVFKVKASNNDGVWNASPTEIKLTILPPWWRTVWFKILLVVLFIYGTFLFIRIRTYSLQQRKKLLVQKVKERTEELEKQKDEIKRISEQLHEADQSKLRFFANISHEFRTPLSLIVGPLEKYLNAEQSTDWTKVKNSYLELMHRNAKRLLRLINEIIDFRKIDQGEKKLNISNNNIEEFIKEIVDAFSALAESKNIDLRFKKDNQALISSENLAGKQSGQQSSTYNNFWFDPDVMEKILYNLISNAIKYTNEEGNVSVQLSVNSEQSTKNSNQSYDSPLNTDNCLLITVKDTGIGIDKENLDKIFDRFYRVGTEESYNKEGAGIGLSYAKELVTLYKGTISVESEINKGTTFTLSFPINKKNTDVNDTNTSVLNQKINLDYTRSTIKSYLNSEGDESVETKNQYLNLIPDGDGKQKPSLLVIEDNADMREFIVNELKDQYKVIEAKNGIEGLEIAAKIIPDIIISDIMMPGMTGNLVCEKLKNNGNTSHIPIILLTAKAGEDNILEGLKNRADDYITKPFNTSILKIKLTNLIETRRLLREKFSKSISLNPGEYTATAFDENFLKKALKIVENNMQDTNFDNTKFVSLTGYGKTFVYTKIKNLTGLSVSEFIRVIKLKRAAQLLQEGGRNVTEVAYNVGFTDSSHFSKYFNKMFGKTPTQFMNENS